jgi:hypothetical protein
MSKDVKRKEKLKKEKIQKEILDKFPKLVIFKEEDAPDNMVSAFKKQYNTMLFTLNCKKNRTQDETIVYEFLKAIKKFDLDLDSKNALLTKKIMDMPFFKNIFIMFNQTYGHSSSRFMIATLQIVVSCITSYLFTKTYFDKFLPNYFFTMGYLNNEVYLRFFKISFEKTQNGTIFKHFKKINVEGQNYEIYFSKHSLDRIFQRIVSTTKYSDKKESFLECIHKNITMDAFAEFIISAKFEFCGFSKNQHLLCCYMPLTYDAEKKIKSNNFKKFKFELPNLKNEKYEAILMRYFYFPFFVQGNKIICKSSLLAGYSGTPEFYLRNSILAKRISLKGLISPNDEELFVDIMGNFYSKQKSNSFIFTEEFNNILIVYHHFNNPQFFKGEWESLPRFAKLSKEILAI